jgi:hypothetical protein
MSLPEQVARIVIGSVVPSSGLNFLFVTDRVPLAPAKRLQT